MTGTSVTERAVEWTDLDRDLVLALLAEERDTCPGCGHPLETCRDRSTAGKWSVEEDVCQACLVGQAMSESNMNDKRRGVHLYTVLRK